MKVTRAWLQTYFEKPLPSVEKIADALTFHAFEIDSVDGDTLDVKVLPNRAADCLSHRGIAKELSAILEMPLKADPFHEPLPDFPKTNALEVTIEDSQKCSRYIGGVMTGVKIGPSPSWLTEALESVGQRSINNVVDATNYVMLDIGQPLHAFDAKKLAENGGKHYIGVRGAKAGENITLLTGETCEPKEGMQLIVDAGNDAPLGVAGVKGGKAAEITGETTDIVIEAANFDGTSVRRTAQGLKLFTDASLRFQNRPSPELAAYGMAHVIELIKNIAGGELVGVVDVYKNRPEPEMVSVSLGEINGLLGSSYTKEEVEGVFTRLGFEVKLKGEMWTVRAPFERTDITVREDLVEEVGRVLGYDRITPTLLPTTSVTVDQARYRGMERMKDQLVEQGFTEVSTQSFVKKGDVTLANPLDKTKPMLRTTLETNLKEALEKAKHYAPLVLPPKAKPKLFEVGTVFPKSGEFIELRMTEKVPAWGEITSDNLTAAKLEDYGKEYTPKRYELGAYKAFSAYPFIARDIALWVPTGTDGAAIEKIIRDNGGELLTRLDQFDRFEKDGKTSYAFRLIFESMERTLTDEEVNSVMQKITEKLNTTPGFAVR